MLENRNGDECYLGYCLCTVLCFSHQLFGLEEALEMLHLPDAGDDEDDGLSDGPPQNTLVRALACHAETFLAVLRKNNVPSAENQANATKFRGVSNF